MSAGKSILGCLAVLAGIIGIFIAITISFTFYLIPLAFLLFIGSLIMISLALGPAAPPDATKKPPGPSSEHKPGPEK